MSPDAIACHWKKLFYMQPVQATKPNNIKEQRQFNPWSWTAFNQSCSSVAFAIANRSAAIFLIRQNITQRTKHTFETLQEHEEANNREHQQCTRPKVISWKICDNLTSVMDRCSVFMWGGQGKLFSKFQTTRASFGDRFPSCSPSGSSHQNIWECHVLFLWWILFSVTYNNVIYI